LGVEGVLSKRSGVKKNGQNDQRISKHGIKCKCWGKNKGLITKKTEFHRPAKKDKINFS
jgi:hypothetical protein